MMFYKDDKEKNMNISNEDNAVQNGAEVDALRNALADGSFGTEGDRDETDAAADDDLVDNFISMFGSEGSTPLKAHDWKAYIPSSIYNNSNFFGPLFGVIREESESIYIFDSKQYEDDKFLIGFIDNGSYLSKKIFNTFLYNERKKCKLIGTYKDNKLILEVAPNRYNDTEFAIDSLRKQLTGEPDLDRNGTLIFSANSIRIKLYDTVTNLFSRNAGLLESSAMLDKRVVLVGCGSVGSFAAMQLARSGVGKFVLCDTDTLEIHNICRHQCGFDDLGRYKVDAVKDKILNINPNAEVITYRSIIQRVPEDELLPLLGKDTIIIGGGDNRGSSDWACKLAIKTDSSFVATGCWTRAFAGEIFYWTPGRNLSCYSCAFKDLIDEDRPESHATYFGDEEEKETLAFEPGIAVDIDFVTIIAVKLSLDLLNQDNDNYTPRVIDYLKQYTWVCNTNNTKIGGPKAAMFPNPLWITNNLSVNKDKDCPYCSNK